MTFPDLNAIARPNVDAERLTKPLPSAQNQAKNHLEIIKTYMLAFQNGLDNEHDVGLMLTNFGQRIIMQVQSITYENSSLMVFRGIVDGASATLIQHISQLSFLLTTVPKNPETPKRKIGFYQD